MNKLLTEFIGTFFLVLTIGLSIAHAGNMAPLAIGTVLMVMVYMGGHISGAHYNPAATLGIFLRGKIEGGEAGKYMVVQVVGAILAAVVSMWMLGGDTFAPAPGGEFGAAQALVAEILFTFALVLVILNVATSEDTDGNSYYGLAIGFTVMAGAYAVGSISGAAFNPAVGLGSIIVDVTMNEASAGFGNVWIYLVGPLVGGALAASVYNMQNQA